MKQYTVKDIATLLKINPETVRRWIRKGELEATQISRAAGNMVSEEALKKFLKSVPQYAPLAAGLVLPGVLGASLSIAAATTIVCKTAMRTGAKRIVTPEYIRTVLTEEIVACEKEVAKKKAEISRLQKEVESKQKHIEEYKDFLEYGDLEKMATEIKENLEKA